MTWGINDFDETYPLPYTFDLVRLATSAHLAIAAGHLKLGEKDACEAKALAPSACAWAADLAHPPEILCQDILNRSVRAMDPFVKLQGRWIVRRLAPDCSRIELASLAPERDEARLLHHGLVAGYTRCHDSFAASTLPG